MPRLTRLLLTNAIFSIVLLHVGSACCQELPEAIRLYGQAWEESNFEKRITILKLFWTEESVYEDPGAYAKGLVPLKDVIDKFWQDFQGASFEMGTVLSHGNFHTWTWKIFDKEKNFILSGVDVAEINEQGRMIHLIGFWDTKHTRY